MTASPGLKRAALLAVILLACGYAKGDDPVMDEPGDWVSLAGVPGGICCLVEPDNAQPAIGVFKQGSFVVHCLVREETKLQRIRKEIRAAGCYGKVSAALWRGAMLPYADNLINMVVVMREGEAGPADPSEKELLRVLVPGGTLFRPDASSHGRWRAKTKERPKNIDEWTHYLHGADGNPVAMDEEVGPPEHYQWVTEPMWMRSHETDSSVATVVTTDKKLFAIVDEAPISLAGQHPLPDKWMLVARDAFNGVLLWKTPIERWGWREWKDSWFCTRPGDYPFDIRKRLVAVGDKVYVTLAYKAPVSQLDAATGRILQVYEDTDRTGEILVHEDTLIVSVHKDGDIRIMAVRIQDGETLWTSESAYEGSTVDYLRFTAMHGRINAPELVPALNIATDGTVVACLDGTRVACVDFATGEALWESDFPEDERDRSAGGIRAMDRAWNGTMIVKDGVVLQSSPHKLAAFSAKEGSLLWEQPKRFIGHLWYEWKDIFVIDGWVWTWGEDLAQGEYPSGKRVQRTMHPQTVRAYDLHTGELKRTVDLGAIFQTYHHHRCYRNKATCRYILASRRGTEFVDLWEGKHSVHNWVRSTCHVGMMPANGFQYLPPHPCACYIDEKLNGFQALASALSVQWPATSDKERLRKGPAYGGISTPAEGERDAAEAWPVFRHDAMRTGSTETELPREMVALWQASLQGLPSAPVVAGKSVYVALVDEHQVVSLDADTGKEQWTFTAGARIDSPPTLYQGSLLFGCRDGWVYCLRAEDGQEAWRFQAAPSERQISAFGQLESAWPVHGSVLIQNEKAYFAAGRTSQLDGGLFLYALDPATGHVLHRRRMAGPDYGVNDEGKLVVLPEEGLEGTDTPVYENNYRLPMGCLPDILVGDGEKIYMRSKTFSENLSPLEGKTSLQTRSGFLEDSYFKRTPWSYEQNYARLIVHDRDSVYFVRQFDSLRGLDPTVFFTPGQKGYLLFAKDVGEEKDTWSERVPIRIRAMVLTQDALVLAGPPDVVDPLDPLGSFEGRKGGLLWWVDVDVGKKRQEAMLVSPPVFNGMAAARGRLYVATEDGALACWGAKR